MGRKSVTGGVSESRGRCQIVFYFQGKRYRPTLNLTFTPSNIRAAQRIKSDIDRRIADGTFDFAAEFPEYQRLAGVPGLTQRRRPTFNDVADDYLASLEGIAHSTKVGYTNVLAAFWRPKIGARYIDDIRYSDLKKIVAAHPWSSVKTRNNYLSIMKVVFEFAVADEIIPRNPAEALRSVRHQKPVPDPFTLEEAERIIAGIREDWDERFADYIEWQLFTGCRPSETIALRWGSIDLAQRTASIDEARVYAQDKDTTKTRTSRLIELNGRAYAVLQRQRAVSQLAGRHVFLRADGQPWHDLQVQWKRWSSTLKRLGIRYRRPYQLRHTSVTWNLLAGKNPLWVADQHGHGMGVSLKVYARWLRGTSDAEIERLKRALDGEVMDAQALANALANRG